MKLLVRTDASSEIGIGHVMRMLALAQGWMEQSEVADRQQPFAVTFLSCALSAELTAKLEAEGIDVVSSICSPGSTRDAEETCALALQMEPAWVVIDGYVFDSNYFRMLRDNGCRLLCIDDDGRSAAVEAEGVLNQNPSTVRLRQLYGDVPLVLLGTEYILLRNEFVKHDRHRIRPESDALHVLVTFGGADSKAQAGKVVQVLLTAGLKGLQVRVLVGPGNVAGVQLLALAERYRDILQIVLDPVSMPEHLSWADLAISAAGSTSWELAYMGVPSILVAVAENQVGIAEGLEKRGAARNLGWYSDVKQSDLVCAVREIAGDCVLRSEMRRAGRRLVDGRGRKRVVDALLAHSRDSSTRNML